jgi:hypothetical protein
MIDKSFLNTIENINALFNSLSNLINSPSDFVNLKWLDSKGLDVNVKVPSFSFLQNELKRLDNNIKNLMGLENSSFIKNPDGSVSKIISYDLEKSLIPPTSIVFDNKFYVKNNLFFENFLNPLLIVKLDVSSFSTINTNKFIVRRTILDIDSDTKKSFFDSFLSNRTDINPDTFEEDLKNNLISYRFDDNVFEVSPSVHKYYGDFDVLDIIDVDFTIGNIKTRKKKYILNTLKYSNVLNTLKNSETIKINDLVRYKNSVFKIQNVFKEENGIILDRISGYDIITIGTNVLHIYNGELVSQYLEVPVNKGEYQIIFIKPVDKIFNVTTNKWSNGVAFFSGSLNPSFNSFSSNLDDFYKNYVLDFGKVFNGITKEDFIPANLGLKPDPPFLNADDFKVVQVNTHKINDVLIDDIKNKISEKIKIQTELDNLKNTLEQKKMILFTNNNLTLEEKNNLNKEIQNLTKDYNIKFNNYSSIVSNLSLLKQSNPELFETPKYRIRGFFEIPKPKKSDFTRDQEVIQFIIEYRYLNKNNSSSKNLQFKFKKLDGQSVSASFSNWIQVKTPVRKKVYDENKGTFIWDFEKVEDPDVTNINQVDIPISKNETVEIRIKSVSEAGYPFNPIESDYSQTVSIDFPNELIQDNGIAALLENIDKELIISNMRKELEGIGLSTHLNKSVFIGDKYFAHDSSQIASGFFTKTGQQMTLYEKTSEIISQIELLNSLLEKSKVSPIISIIDENGKEYLVKQNSVVKLFAGYYLDEIDKLDPKERKGAIITKSYILRIKNIESKQLELFSKYFGGIKQRMFNTTDPSALFLQKGNWYNESLKSSDTLYNLYRRYDYVPINHLSISSNDISNSGLFSSRNMQSPQTRGQYIYLRFLNVTLDDSEPLYNEGYEVDVNGKVKEIERTNYFITDNPPTTPRYPSEKRVFFPYTSGSSVSSPFVWDFANGYDTSGNPVSNGKLTNFCIHVLHPLLKTQKPFEELMFPGMNITGYKKDKTYGLVPITDIPEVYPAFYHSKYFNLYTGSYYFDNYGKQSSTEKVPEHVAISQLNYRNNFYEVPESFWINAITDAKGLTTPPSSLTGFTYPQFVYFGLNTNDFLFDFTNLNTPFVYKNKIGFFDYDRYLIGRETCGCYLFLSPTNYDQILVGGQDPNSLRILNKDEFIDIPIIFQYRMIDFYGQDETTGLGVVMGYDETKTQQIFETDTSVDFTLKKRIGIDLYVNNNDSVISFDVEVSCKLRNKNKNIQITDIGNSVTEIKLDESIPKQSLNDL